MEVNFYRKKFTKLVWLGSKFDRQKWENGKVLLDRGCTFGKWEWEMGMGMEMGIEMGKWKMGCTFGKWENGKVLDIGSKFGQHVQ